MSFHVPEKYRVKTGNFGTDASFGNNGLFFIHQIGKVAPLRAIVSDGEGWEHVSVSLPDRCPTWDEMCKVKDLFWDDEDCVVQFHPPKSEYVNCHPYCLHLWRKVGSEFETPPSIMVGIKKPV